jgi:hypothetical protein
VAMMSMVQSHDLREELHVAGVAIGRPISSRPAGARSAARPPRGLMRGVLTRQPLPEPSCTSRLTEPIR